MMKILMTGASGMLAGDLLIELRKSGIEALLYDVNRRLAEIKSLDVTEFADVYDVFEKEKPDYIFHLAAETDVDRCEKEPEHAFKVNALGTENVARSCQKLGIKLVYISTAGVFGRVEQESYTELDRPDPVNVYGLSKLKGEEIVAGLLKEYFIVRAGWMMGGWEIDKKFVKKIVQQLEEGKTEIRAVVDKFGSPTFTKDLSKNLVELLKTGRYGLYHMANKGKASKYDIALKIVEYMGLAQKVKVLAVNSDQFPSLALRPHCEAIINHRLNELNLDLMPHWEESLKEYIFDGMRSRQIR